MKFSILLALAFTTQTWAQDSVSEAEPQQTQPAPAEVRWTTVDDVTEQADAPQQVILVRTQEEKAAQAERGFLGVFLSDDGKHVSVSKVSAGSGAEKAGLQAGDRILSVNQNEVKDSARLIEALAPFKQGEQVAIQAQRGAEQMLFMVTLGERPQTASTRVPAAPIAPEVVVEEVEENTPRHGGFLFQSEREVDPESVEMRGFHFDGPQGDGGELNLSQEQLEELLKQVAELQMQAESGDGDGMFTWSFESELGAGPFEPGMEIEVEGIEESEPSEVHEGHPFLHWLGTGEKPHGMFRIQLQCDDEDSDCGAGSCCEEEECEGHGKGDECEGCERGDLGDGDECCEPQEHHFPRLRALFGLGADVHRLQVAPRRSQTRQPMNQMRGLRALFGSQRGEPGQRARSMFVRRGPGLHGMLSTEPMGRMRGGPGTGPDPMMETLQEMRAEMQAMHKELVKLRKEVRSLRGQGNKQQKAATKKKKAKATKGKASVGAAPRILKRVIVSDGGQVEEVILTEDGEGGDWIEVTKD